MAEDKIKVLPAKRFNVVQLIFFILLIYMVIITGKYLSKDDVRITEITEGSLDQNHTYSGLILRNEEILTADTNGYLKCYTSDGEKVSRDSVLFAIDKTGENLGTANSTKTEISDDEYKTIRKYLNRFTTNYDGTNFSTVYNFKNQLLTVLYSIEQQDAETDENSDLSMIQADKGGLIYYSLDGFEEKTADDFTRADLENLSYRSTRVASADEVKAGQAIAKLIPDETWQILVPVTDDDAEYYQDLQKADIYLNDIKTKTSADIEIKTDSDGGKYAVLTLGNYMSSFSSDRIVSVSLLKELMTGLKVPKSSIVSDDLYVIPAAYGNTDENGNVSFTKKTEDKNGTIAYVQVSPDISYADGNYYYIDDPDVIQKDDIICKVQESDGEVTASETYTIGEKQSLEGVYCVNKGYAVFEVVTIKDEDDSYCIVQSGTTYGLGIYDHIVLNAASISEDELIY